MPLVLRKSTADIAEQMRPKSWHRTYRVGPEQTYATVNLALNALRAENLAEFGDRYGPWPGIRFRVLIDPGLYEESLNTTASMIANGALPTEAIPQFTDFIGNGEGPDDVVIWWRGRVVPEQVTAQYPWGRYDVGVFRVSGSAYIANLTLELRRPDGGEDTTPSSHRTGIHALVYGGVPFPYCLIVDRCRLLSEHNATNGATCIDGMVGDDATVILIDTELRRPEGEDFYNVPQAAQVSFLPNGVRTAPGVFAFIGCTAASPACEYSIVNFNDQFNDGIEGDAMCWLGGVIERGIAPLTIHITNTAEHHAGYFIVDPAIDDVLVPVVGERLVRSRGLPFDPPVDGLTPAVAAWLEAQ